MSFLYRIGLLLALAGGPLLTISSCSSDKKEDPQPTTGSLAGTVNPAGSLSKVTATDAGGLTFVATPEASGAFTIADLKPGVYILSFTPATGYLQPGTRSITIVAGQKAAAGTVEVESDGSIRSGTVSWNRDGVAYSTTTVQGSYAPQFAGANTLMLLAKAATGGTQNQVDIRIDYLTSLAPNTYQLRRTTGPGGVSEGFYTTSGASATSFYVVDTGSLTITSFDATTRVLSGTFAFTADGFNNTTGTTSISNGTFRVQL
ncbi:hypothetical protein Q5H93_14480 [Hymenobacter sp. ASUV-10]|uniref:Carboxypeptidase regulatory-like domain-containing protein n=1 Tax=Hymenobacter aranciens TaxID=3063996 RepID=A0ABT9BCG0_9BACT|nr:hypothetical protein [Hymenobacter sp. ASUV-10]MDO7875947.1 hypothetical protein [Hymenobacter sp. ASUV-10]